MFEQELYNKITNKFNIEGFTLGFGFGEVIESQKAPYIVMFPLNNDGTKQVLCDDNDYTDGDLSVQFNVYDVDYSNACYIARQLDIFLAELNLLDTYRILINNHETTRGNAGTHPALSLETITRRFTYTKLEEI